LNFLKIDIQCALATYLIVYLFKSLLLMLIKIEGDYHPTYQLFLILMD